jgi:preprotein translocase SecF subunit
MPRPWFKPIEFVPAGTKFSFVSHYRLALAETAVLAVLTVVLLSTLGLNFGVDFRGGTMIELRTTDGAADIGAMRSKVGALNLGGLQIQQFGAPNEVLIRIEEQPGGDKTQQEAVGKVQAALGDNIEIRRVEMVGATVSAELITSAITALTLATLGIFAYLWFRFEWQFSVSAIVALLHDMAMVLCLFSILQMEVDLTIVAALLTLIGYAVNDTVVTFDRVRENLRKYKRMPLDELIDLSVNETLSRTAMTAGAVLITLVALFVLAGPVIRGFTLAMLFGGVVSSYTSMFVAAPLLYVIGVKREWGIDVASQGKRATRRPA